MESPRYPHPCGEQFEKAVATGADPRSIVPDDYFVVKGGTAPLPADGGVFSGAVGPTLEAASCAVPHRQLRFSTVGAIRAAGGAVWWEPELSRHLTLNFQHVNIIEAGPTTFSELGPNPVSRPDCIDGTPPNPRSAP